jgi:hypothetical protein
MSVASQDPALRRNMVREDTRPRFPTRLEPALAEMRRARTVKSSLPFPRWEALPPI